MKSGLFSLVRVCVLLALLWTLALGGLAPTAAQARTDAASAAASRPSGLAFIENAGQFAGDARFQVRGRDFALWLAEDALWLTVFDRGSTSAGSPTSPASGVNVKVSFPGSNPQPSLEPFDRLETRVSFFTGADPASWRPDVPAWGGVRYAELYPGIDLEVTGAGDDLVLRLAARPGADLGAVRLWLEGAEGVTVEGNSLRLSAAGRAVYTLPLLRADGATGRAAVQARGAAAFEVVAPFASEEPSPADTPSPADNPADLVYSTFLGGSGADQIYDIAVDGSGAAYVTGETLSADFPSTPGAFDPSYNLGYADAFVAKVNVCGSSLEYATFLGGRNGARGYDIAVDGSGAAYVTGDTWSLDFATTPGAWDTSHNGGADAFVAKLNPAGTALLYATYLGGSGDEPGRGIAVDGSGAAFITGHTLSSDFPTTPGAFDTSFAGGEQDIFVAKLNPAGSALDYATFLGGVDNEEIPAIAVDGNGAAFVTGHTWSADFPTTAGAWDTVLDEGDAFVAKLNPAGSALDYATFLGGSEDDGGNGIAVDGTGAAYVVGDSWSEDFPVTPDAFDTDFGECEQCRDAFVAKFNAAGTALDYATFLGGNARERGESIYVDGGGAAFVTGTTWSPDFPVTPGAFDTSYNANSNDAFVAKVNDTGSALDYSTFLSGFGDDWGEGIAVDGSGAIYVAGHTGSSDLPTTLGSFDPTHNGGSDGFVAKLAIGGAPGFCITGHVTDPGGKGVAHVTVSAGTGGWALTDSSGNYAIGNVVTGTYTLIPTFVGSTFDPTTRTVDVPPDATGQDFQILRFWLYVPVVLRNQ